MTDTLFTAVLRTAELLGGLVTGTATGGSTTTIIDTTRTETNDFFNTGTGLIIYDAGALGAAPQGEWGKVSDWVLATSTLTMATLTAAVGAGDIYGIIPPRWPLDTIINKINTVLTGILIPHTDTTSLDTASNQTEYDLPAAIPANDLRKVYWQGNLDDANDNQWIEIRNWEVIHSDTGTADVLVIPQLTNGRDIRLDYVAPHPAVYTAAAEISELIHMDRIKYRVAERMFIENITTNESYANIKDLSNYYAVQADRADLMHPVRLPPINSRIISYAIYDRAYPGDRNPR